VFQLVQKFAFSFEHHVIDRTVEHKDTLISNITRLSCKYFLYRIATQSVLRYLYTTPYGLVMPRLQAQSIQGQGPTIQGQGQEIWP